jgi:transposase-like protein
MINATRYYPWLAVEQDGDILDIPVQRRRNKKAAKKSSASCSRG